MEKVRKVIVPPDSSMLNPDRLIKALAKKTVTEEAEKVSPLDLAEADAELLGVPGYEITEAELTGSSNKSKKPRLPAPLRQRQI